MCCVRLRHTPSLNSHAGCLGSQDAGLQPRVAEVQRRIARLGESEKAGAARSTTRAPRQDYKRTVFAWRLPQARIELAPRSD